MMEKARSWLQERSKKLWRKHFLVWWRDERQRRRVAAKVGTELKRIFGSFMISSTPDCPCNKRAELLDLLGSRWVRANIDSVVDWLQGEYHRRKEKIAALQAGLKHESPENLPAQQVEVEAEIKRLGGRILKLPFSPIVVKRIVLIAIRRAERAKH